MSPERQRVLAYVREHPGEIDLHVHRGLGYATRYMESTVKHLLRLRDAGLVRSEGSAAKWERRWYAVEAAEEEKA